MSLEYLTLFHVLVSLIALAAGCGALASWMAGERAPRWTAWFMVTTTATSATGFLFPYGGVTPGIVLGVVSLVALAAAGYAWYRARLAGGMRRVFIVNAIMALYLNALVLVVQLFQKVPLMESLAPTQSELPFAVTQLLLLAASIVLGRQAWRRFPAGS